MIGTCVSDVVNRRNFTVRAARMQEERMSSLLILAESVGEM